MSDRETVSRAGEPPEAQRDTAPENPPSHYPTHPLPNAQVTAGMAVADRDGGDVGTVTGVEMPGPAAEAGRFRVEGGGLPSKTYEVGGDQIDGVTTTGDDGVVTLTVRGADLRPAE